MNLSFRNFIKPFFELLIIGFITLLLLEIIFLVLPTSNSSNLKHTNVNNPILRFEPNQKVRKSLGPFFKYSVLKYTNDIGYFSDYGTDDLRGKKFVGVIGDSIVEAVHVANSDTFHGLLNKMNNNFVFLPFAVSGSPLSQYLAFAEYAKSEFKPSLYIITIIANDFDESLTINGTLKGFYQYDKEFKLGRWQERDKNLFRQFLKKSALVRYLYSDLKIMSKIESFTLSNISEANLYKNLNIDKFMEAELLIENFISDLKKIVDDIPVLFVLDSDRDAMYAKYKVKRSMGFPRSEYVNYAFNEFKLSCCILKNFHYLDTSMIFDHFLSKSPSLLDFSDVGDGHWNEVAHSLVANAIYDWMLENI